jgi:hypothetical protein
MVFSVAAGFSLRQHRLEACATKKFLYFLAPNLPLGNENK